LFLIYKIIITDNIRDNLTKYYENIRIICSYEEGLKLKLIEKTDELDAYVTQIVKKIKKNIILTKNIAIYKRMNSDEVNEELNIEKLKIIQDFYLFINKKTNNDNIFDLINFDKFKENVYNLLEKYKDLYLSFNSDNLYNIDIIYKKENNYKLSHENRNFIDQIMIKFLNEVIDEIYDIQTINYYLDMYHL
jgi:hypothetical protein